jgi:hypothetical protein
MQLAQQEGIALSGAEGLNALYLSERGRRNGRGSGGSGHVQ